ncbi:hypothetical protein CPAR01_14245 [Colletotrichum paranaense]|uniref:Uncharacterized protein n=1 Tax=Colletotrichum paranaense TaxID=1914294 RepID=A0ABQ9S1M1_9PEZI|nr:uncharacterized protein CPAR01_14245 [Colletotrichum paranaense]KAK1522702.1 hypothetical protein CPAR01_14245 [Colletotrichum paranaense]
MHQTDKSGARGRTKKSAGSNVQRRGGSGGSGPVVSRAESREREYRDRGDMSDQGTLGGTSGTSWDGGTAADGPDGHSSRRVASLTSDVGGTLRRVPPADAAELQATTVAPSSTRHRQGTGSGVHGALGGTVGKGRGAPRELMIDVESHCNYSVQCSATKRSRSKHEAPRCERAVSTTESGGGSSKRQGDRDRRPDFRKEAETTAYAAGSPQIIRGDSWNSPNGSGFPVQDLCSWLQAEAGRQIQKAVKAQIGRATITLIGPFILGVLLESL